MVIREFFDLDAWKKAHALTLKIYCITKQFPKDEIFGVTSQLRRSSSSVAANIAEGFRKRGKADKLRFYNIAQGSLEESYYYLILAKDLNYCNSEPLQELYQEVGKLLEAYSKSIRKVIS